MCLLLIENLQFFEKSIAPRLSIRSRMGKSTEIFISRIMHFSHRYILEPWQAAMYSASKVDRAILYHGVPCYGSVSML
jgi:hypothetical protein